MPNKLQEFEEALNLLPEGIQNFIEIPIPTPPEASLPATIEDAVIVNGKASYYFLELFRPFAGVTPVEIFMRIGQKNETLQSILKAMIEYTNAEGLIEIVAPVNEGVYYGYFENWQVICHSEAIPKSLKVSCGGHTREMTAGEEGVYTANIIIPLGTYAASITAAYEDGSEIKSLVKFQVKSVFEMPTFPEEGETLPKIKTLTAMTGLSTDDFEAVQCILDGQTYLMEKEEGLHTVIFSSPLNVLGPIVALFRFLRGGNIIEKPVHFTITE